MSTTSPTNGLPVPDDDSPNDPPIHFQALVDVLDSRLNSRHASAAARDTAIPSPVADQECTVNGVGKQVYVPGKGWVTVYGYDPYQLTRFLGEAHGSDSTKSGTTMVTAHSITVTVPAGLTAGKLIKVTATAFLDTAAGVGAAITVQGGTQRAFNSGSIAGDCQAFRYDTSLTAGPRTYNLQVRATVASQDVIVRSPHLAVELI